MNASKAIFVVILRKMIEVVLTSIHLALQAQVKTCSQHAQKQIHVCQKDKYSQSYTLVKSFQLT